MANEVQARLQETGYQPLRHLRVEVRHELVMLTGHVPTFYLKQFAQTIAGAVVGVDRVCNQIVVASPNPTTALD